MTPSLDPELICCASEGATDVTERVGPEAGGDYFLFFVHLDQTRVMFEWFS